MYLRRVSVCSGRPVCEIAYRVWNRSHVQLVRRCHLHKWWLTPLIRCLCSRQRIREGTFCRQHCRLACPCRQLGCPPFLISWDYSHQPSQRTYRGSISHPRWNFAESHSGCCWCFRCRRNWNLLILIVSSSFWDQLDLSSLHGEGHSVYQC